jgi:hypothetical protein
MYVATMETQHFSFMAVGISERDAGHLLLQTFKSNLERNGALFEAADKWSVGDLEDEWGIWYYHVNPGDGFCDGERIVTP